MRQIIFRAQDIASNKWYYGDLRLHKNDVCIFGQETLFGEQVKEETVGQCTGMKDINGTTIWEGDIVEVTCLKADERLGETIRAYVTYDDDMAAFVLCNGENKAHGSALYSNRNVAAFEVIGNIHENAELLQGKK